MPRPHRPNPIQKSTGDHKARIAAHPKQETRSEAQDRKRAEAEARNAETPIENTRRYRRAKEQAK